MEELRKLGPLAVRGKYVAFAASAVTPELAAALEPERFDADVRSAARGAR
jgi:hypothetical protein